MNNYFLLLVRSANTKIIDRWYERLLSFFISVCVTNMWSNPKINRSKLVWLYQIFQSGKLVSISVFIVCVLVSWDLKGFQHCVCYHFGIFRWFNNLGEATVFWYDGIFLCSKMKFFAIRYKKKKHTTCKKYKI